MSAGMVKDKKPGTSREADIRFYTGSSTVRYLRM